MIPRDLLRKIRLIEISTNRLVDQRLAGQYQSVFKGRGMAFEEVRPYAPGDDVRIIDWNVSARMNEPFVKRFTEERDQTVMLVVDMSASGLFGSQMQTKREVAAEVAALIAFSAIKNNDRVGLIVFTDTVELFVPPKKGKRHVLRVIREILRFEPTSSLTAIDVGLEYLRKVTKRKAVVFLVSDFLADGWQRSVRLASKRHDLVPVVITDPLEDRLPRLGLVPFADLETGEVILFDTCGPEAEAYREEVARQRQTTEQTIQRLRLDAVKVATDRPYVDALVQFFQTRSRRLQA